MDTGHRYIGLFCDYSYASHSIEDHGELFADIEHAKDELLSRFERGRGRVVRPVFDDDGYIVDVDHDEDETPPEVDCPSVSKDAGIELFKLIWDEERETATWSIYPHGTVMLTTHTDAVFCE